MIISFSILLGLISTVFFYRRFIILKVVVLLWILSTYTIKLYYYIKKRRDNRMYKVESKELNGYFLETYNLIKDDKDYKVMFMSRDKKEIGVQINDFKNNIDDNIMNKDLIVHCNISNDDELVVELTKIIRKFCYYFDKDYKLDIFIEYLHDYISENYSDMQHINIYKYNLCVFLNDNQFTEKAFSLKSVMNEGKTFKELICM